jgi:hypothetical protein
MTKKSFDCSLVLKALLASSQAVVREYSSTEKESQAMKKRALALSFIVLICMVFMGASTFAQDKDNTWVDEEVAPPAPPEPAPPPAPARRAVWGGRWPWTSARLIQPPDLMPLSLGELELMRNEIYARHGWVFRRPDLQNYFESQPWYRPKSDNAYYSNRQVEAELTPIEKRNLQIIISRENALRR